MSSLCAWLSPMGRRLLVGVALAAAAAGAAAQAATQGGAYGGATGIDSARFGALVGAMTGYRPSLAEPAAPAASWGGAPQQSCAGVDFDTYVNTLKSQEVLNQLKSTYQAGPQSALANYMLTLTTSNPTLAATLDMVDRMLASRYAGFARMCQAQDAARQAADPQLRQYAEATDQCFAARLAQGSSPSVALRECKNANVVGAQNIPGRQDLKGFLKTYTNVRVDGDLEHLLGLLADEQITAQGLQTRAPQRSLTQVKGHIEDHARNALNRILDGVSPDELDTCRGEHFALPPASPSQACIPAAASALVRGQAFLAARSLNAAEQDMYASALSEQMSAVAVQSAVIALRQALTNLGPKAGSTVSAGELAARRARIQAELARLENDAAQLTRVADQRAQIARSQLLAMQRASEQTAARRDAAERSLPAPKPNAVSGLRSFLGL